MTLKPGAPLTGAVIVATLAVLAHLGVLGIGGLVWDDAVFLGRDPRIRELSFLWEAFGEPYFVPPHRNEMYRPLVSASFALDWAVSGSAPGAPTLWWFHLQNLLLHAANAAVAYVFLVELTGRRLGAPLLAACLFAVHPLAVEPVAWLVGRCDLHATLFGLLAGVLLLRSARKRSLLWPAVLCYGIALFAKASAAFVPAIVAAGVVAYRGLPPRQLLGRRLLPRFSLFAVPAVIWLAARWSVLGWPVPHKAGLAWHDDVTLLDAVFGVGRAFFISVTHLFVPARLTGDYSGDPAWHPVEGGLGPQAVIGLCLIAAATVYGVTRLRSRPRYAFPVLAFLLALVPVLQLVRIGAILADRFLYLPMIFAFLLVGEGLERVFGRHRATMSLTFVLLLLLGVQSHLRTPVWEDDVTFNEDVVSVYPEGRSGRFRLARALDARAGPGDVERAEEMLRELIMELPRPDDELTVLGAMRAEAGDLDEAETLLRRAVEDAGGKPLTGAVARYNLAVVRKALGDLDEARDLLREALRREPALSQAQTLLRKIEGP
jgi:hypothetical protein